MCLYLNDLTHMEKSGRLAFREEPGGMQVSERQDALCWIGR